jgi:Bacteriocin-protection, YdeI or OmpD-Associated/Domain of unknown function (DUF1905)
MEAQRFETVLQAEGPGVFVEVPLDVPAVFGRARAPVQVTINGHRYRSTVAVYGGRYYLPVNRAVREAAGVEAGDLVVVELEADEAPREVEVPEDLAAALAADERAAAAFERLSYTHRREHVEWVTEAKRPETRRRRVAETVAGLGEPRAR